MLNECETEFANRKVLMLCIYVRCDQ